MSGPNVRHCSARSLHTMDGGRLGIAYYRDSGFSVPAGCMVQVRRTYRRLRVLGVPIYDARSAIVRLIDAGSLSTWQAAPVRLAS